MPKIITGLDVGSSSVKIISAFQKDEEESFEIVVRGQEPSSGIRKGVVIDAVKLAQSLEYSINKIREESGQKVRNVYANVGGSHIFCSNSHGLISVSRADQKISAEDIDRVLQAAQTFSLPSNKEILEIFPKEFAVDGEKAIKEPPVGMAGVRLEVDAVVVGGFSPYLKNSNQAILNSGLQIQGLIPSPIASARSVLTPQERELGVLVLDLGAGTTSLCVFEDENLIHLAVFPVGASNITNDIAICLKTGIDTAEKIKIQFGSSIVEKKSQKRHSKKDQFRLEGPDSEEPLVFTRKTLTKIVEARVSEILKEVQKELKKIGRAGTLPAGVVLTGGGAKLPQIKDFCKKELKLPCRIGAPKGFSPGLDDPALAVAAGLVQEGFDSEGERGFSLQGGGVFTKIKKFFRIFIP